MHEDWLLGCEVPEPKWLKEMVHFVIEQRRIRRRYYSCKIEFGSAKKMV